MGCLEILEQASHVLRDSTGRRVAEIAEFVRSDSWGWRDRQGTWRSGICPGSDEILPRLDQLALKSSSFWDFNVKEISEKVQKYTHDIREDR